MDLTKLRDKWREQAKRQWEDGDNGQSIQSDACADELDAARAAVPQDTVEALAAAASHWHDEMSDHRTDAPAYGQLRSAIRSVLAARPVRAVLKEEQVGKALEESEQDMSTGTPRSRFTAALNAALDRQHAEPPATSTQHWPGCPRKGGIGECDCTGDFSGSKT